MKHYLLGCLFAGGGLFINCANEHSSASAEAEWVSYTLDNHWLFSAPKGARITYLRGLDSVPGTIELPHEAITLEFDSTFEGALDTCTSSAELAQAQAEVARGAYAYLDKPDTLHLARVDTISGLAATIITPKRAGAGTTTLFISSCKYHCGLGIYGKNLPLAKQELLLELFNSIRYKASK
jgi:hypothetical protein